MNNLEKEAKILLNEIKEIGKETEKKTEKYLKDKEKERFGGNAYLNII